MSRLTVKELEAPTGQNIELVAGETLDLSAGTVTLPTGTGGKVLQVVSNTSLTSVVTTSSTPLDVMSISITPSATSSKIYLMFSGMNQAYGNSQTVAVTIRNNFYRGSTVIGNSGVNSVETGNMYSNAFYIGFPIAVNLLDSPSSTSQVTYTLKTHITGSGRCGYFGDKSLVAMEIAG